MKFFGFLVTLLSLSHSIDSYVIQDEPRTSEISELVLQNMHESIKKVAGITEKYYEHGPMPPLSRLPGESNKNNKGTTDRHYLSLEHGPKPPLSRRPEQLSSSNKDIAGTSPAPTHFGPTSTPSERSRINEKVDKNFSMEAVEERFPFLVIVKVTTFDDQKLWCNGVLIKEDCVLTTTNCISEAFYPASKVTLSSISLEGSDKNGRTIPFRAFYTHPNYKSKTGVNDLAIIKLSETVNSEKIIGITSEVKIKQNDCDVGSPLVVGYHPLHEGLTIVDSFDVQIMSGARGNIKCEQMLHETQPNAILHDSQFCIKNDNENTISVTDVLVQKQCGKYMLIGLVTNDHVVTRAGYYMNWINRHI